MCYEWGVNGAYHNRKTARRLSIDVVEDIIRECSPVKPFYELYGGEPLLYPEIERVLTAIQAAGSAVHLPTNGTLLKKHAGLLVDKQVDRIWVSLDGPQDINDAQRGSGVFEDAIAGINEVHALRTQRAAGLPRIGVSTVVTPANHQHLETFFFQSIDIGKLDCVSIELQAYLRKEDHEDYEEVLRTAFGVQDAPIASGFVNDPAIFAEMDFGLIATQVGKIQDYCRSHNLYLNTYPKVMTEDNVRKHFTANWFQMSGIKRRCPFPWISTEINARGDVTSCHAFYDLTLGNVNDTSIGDIWRGERYSHYRAHLRKQLLPICQACCLFHNTKPPQSVSPAHVSVGV
jgi:radical SAM protein with 4Fe4S-binding SPASM domain